MAKTFRACAWTVAAILIAGCAKGEPLPRNGSGRPAGSGEDGATTGRHSAPDAAACIRLGPPQPGEWRHRHPNDVPMDFEHYIDSDPVRAEGEIRTIAFLPVGEFDATQRATFEAAAEFTAIWFDLPVTTLAPTELTDEEGQWRRGGDGESRQYRTGWFLNALLPDLRPTDAVVLLGVTMADIYPGPGWNYVFGEADLRRRVGVYSLARYFPEFSGGKPTAAGERMALMRTLKVVVHEAGHTFGLEHCVTWKCAMNGSNSLEETDRQPLALCPDCMEKLAWNREFDVARRDERIAAFLDAHGFPAEAAENRSRTTRAVPPGRHTVPR